MTHIPNPTADEVDQLMLNARLRDELAPFVDESVNLVSLQNMPLSAENEFLESMLAWERAPVLPISKWFEPELTLPSPDRLNASQLKSQLWNTIQQLYSQRIILEFTDHLTDRELYCLICRDILPAFEKKFDEPRNYFHWHCLDDSDLDTWLTYYADNEERYQWHEETGGDLPERIEAPYRRKMPSRPAGL
jgi:hypothetical protein